MTEKPAEKCDACCDERTDDPHARWAHHALERQLRTERHETRAERDIAFAERDRAFAERDGAFAEVTRLLRILPFNERQLSQAVDDACTRAEKAEEEAAQWRIDKECLNSALRIQIAAGMKMFADIEAAKKSLLYIRDQAMSAAPKTYACELILAEARRILGEGARQ